MLLSLPLPLRLLLVVLSLSLTSEVHAKSQRKKTLTTRSSVAKKKKASYQKAAYRKNRSSTRPLLRRPISRSAPASPARQSAVHPILGVVTGFDFLDSNPILLGVDYQWNFADQWFIPVGFSYWKGSVDVGFIKINVTTTTLDSGIGYKFAPSRQWTIPVGTRLGWAELEFSALGQSFAYDGYNVTPFVGASFLASRDISIGYEARVPILRLNGMDDDDSDDDEDEDEEEDSGGKIPVYHMMAVTFHL